MTDRGEPVHVWRVGGGREVTLNEPRLMGIVNATPDSFSDGGLFPSTEALLGHALRMVEEGACIIDVGGESTRPGAAHVGEAEQIDRTAPVIEALRGCSDVLISIDSTCSAVAAAGLEAGASIINDVSAGRDDERMLPLAADRGCGLVLMHRLVRPVDDSYSTQYERPPQYDDVVADVRRFLHERCVAAEAAGAARESIVVDPGLGFGKTVAQNYQLIHRTAELADCGYPVLGAASRKSFVGAASGVQEPRQRVIGSTAVAVIQYLGGVRLFRVHDVEAHRQALAVTNQALRASKGAPPAREPVG